MNKCSHITNEDFFIGVVSSFKNEIEDFEKIIDEIYEKSVTIFKSNVSDKRLLENVKQNYKKLLNLPSDTVAFEKRLEEEHQVFENEIAKLNSVLNELKFTIVSEGKNTLIDKTQNVLNANISTLVSSAKNNTLANTITELLRPHLNAMYKNIIQSALQTVEKESLNISNNFDFSLSVSQIDTKLGFWGTVKNFFFDTQNKEIKEELKRNTIPSVVNDMQGTISQELEGVFENIQKLVNEQIADKRIKSEQITQEIREQMSLKTQEFQKLQKEYKNSLEKLEEL